MLLTIYVNLGRMMFSENSNLLAYYVTTKHSWKPVFILSEPRSATCHHLLVKFGDSPSRNCCVKVFN